MQTDRSPASRGAAPLNAARFPALTWFAALRRTEPARLHILWHVFSALLFVAISQRRYYTRFFPKDKKNFCGPPSAAGACAGRPPWRRAPVPSFRAIPPAQIPPPGRPPAPRFPPPRRACCTQTGRLQAGAARDLLRLPGRRLRGRIVLLFPRRAHGFDLTPERGNLLLLLLKQPIEIPARIAAQPTAAAVSLHGVSLLPRRSAAGFFSIISSVPPLGKTHAGTQNSVVILHGAILRFERLCAAVVGFRPFPVAEAVEANAELHAGDKLLHIRVAEAASPFWGSRAQGDTNKPPSRNRRASPAGRRPRSTIRRAGCHRGSCGRRRAAPPLPGRAAPCTGRDRDRRGCCPPASPPACRKRSSQMAACR